MSTSSSKKSPQKIAIPSKWKKQQLCAQVSFFIYVIDLWMSCMDDWEVLHMPKHSLLGKIGLYCVAPLEFSCALAILPLTLTHMYVNRKHNSQGIKGMFGVFCNAVHAHDTFTIVSFLQYLLDHSSKGHDLLAEVVKQCLTKPKSVQVLLGRLEPPHDLP